MNFNINKKEKELLMYCVLAFATGYLMCMYFPVHGGRFASTVVPMPVLEGMTASERNEIENMTRSALIDHIVNSSNHNNNNNNNNNNNKNNTKNNNGSGNTGSGNTGSGNR